MHSDDRRPSSGSFFTLSAQSDGLHGRVKNNVVLRPRARFWERLLPSVWKRSFPEQQSFLSKEIFKLFILESSFGLRLRLDRANHVFRADLADVSDDDLVVGIKNTDTNEIFLISPDLQECVIVDGDVRLSSVRSFTVLPTERDDAWALKNSHTALFMTAEPPELGGMVAASRRLVNSWEIFSLKEIEWLTFNDQPRLEIKKFVQKIQESKTVDQLMSYLCQDCEHESAIHFLPIWMSLLRCLDPDLWRSFGERLPKYIQ